MWFISLHLSASVTHQICSGLFLGSFSCALCCSSGPERGWVGVPRLLTGHGKLNTRCACVRTSGPPSEGEDPATNRGDLDSPFVERYKNCADDATECFPQN